MAGCCAHGNEPSVFTKFGELLDKLRNGELFKEDSAACS